MSFTSLPSVTSETITSRMASSGIFPPAAIGATTSTTETLSPARITIKVAPSAPTRISSTANAASAGLRSRGAVGSRSPLSGAPSAGAGTG